MIFGYLGLDIYDAFLVPESQFWLSGTRYIYNAFVVPESQFWSLGLVPDSKFWLSGTRYI